MRIAILSDAYLPESTLNHSKMLHDLGVEMHRLGHDIVVMTPGALSQKNIIEIVKLNGVEVWRFRCFPPRGGSRLRRAVGETLLPWFLFVAVIIKRVNINFDIVVNYSPTIFFGSFAFFLKSKGAYVYLVLRDFFPKWVIDQGLIEKDSFVARFFQYFEELNYKSANVIAVQSHGNLDVFRKMVSPKCYTLDVLYNWVEPVVDVDASFGVAYIEKLNLHKKFIFFYGGNIGPAQDVNYILLLARRFSSYPEVHFLIVGQGDEYDSIRNTIKSEKLINVTLCDSVDQDQYRSLLLQVHVGVFTLSDKHVAHNFPGKILGYLQAALPILGAVNNGNDIIQVINQSGSGKVSLIGSDQDFFADALSLYRDSKLYTKMSRSCCALLKEKFDVQIAAKKIINSYCEWKKNTS